MKTLLASTLVPRAAVRLAPALLALGLACPAAADIYMAQAPDGSMSFTDAPLTADYRVVIRDPRPATPTTAPVPTPGAESPWRQIARREAGKRRLDPDLVGAVIRIESGENPLTVSPKGAQGLMQLMPETARLMGVQDPFDPEENIRGGVKYLAGLLERFRGRLDLALAAYNAGPTAVERYGGIPPYAETRNYVVRVMDAYRRFSGRNALDTTLVAMDNRAPVAGRE